MERARRGDSADPERYDFRKRCRFVADHATGRAWLGPPLGSTGLFYVVVCLPELRVGVVVGHVTGSIVRAFVRSCAQDALRDEPHTEDLDVHEFVEIGMAAAAQVVHELLTSCHRQGIGVVELSKRGATPPLIDALLAAAGALRLDQTDDCNVTLAVACSGLPTPAAARQLPQLRAPMPEPHAAKSENDGVPLVYVSAAVRSRAGVLRGDHPKPIGRTETLHSRAPSFERSITTRFAPGDDPHLTLTVCLDSAEPDSFPVVMGVAEICLSRLSCWFPQQWSADLRHPLDREAVIGSVAVRASPPTRLGAAPGPFGTALPPPEDRAVQGCAEAALLLPTAAAPGCSDDSAPPSRSQLSFLWDDPAFASWRFQLDDLCDGGDWSVAGFGGMETAEDLLRRLDTPRNALLWEGFCRHAARWCAVQGQRPPAEQLRAPGRIAASRRLLASAEGIRRSFRAAPLVLALVERSCDLLPLCFELAACQRDLERHPGIRESLSVVEALAVRTVRQLRRCDFEQCGAVLVDRALGKAAEYPRLRAYLQGFADSPAPSQLVAALADLFADPRTSAHAVAVRLGGCLEGSCPPLLPLFAGSARDVVRLLCDRRRLEGDAPPADLPHPRYRARDWWRPLPRGTDDVEADVFCSALPRDSRLAMDAVIAPPLPPRAAAWPPERWPVR